MKNLITKTFEITAAPELMERFERFLALLHFNSGFGHSGMFGMPLDGDGNEKLSVNPRPSRALAKEVECISHVGSGLEYALDGKYGFKKLDSSGACYYTLPAAHLCRDGKIIKTVPGEDWDWKEREQAAGTQQPPPIISGSR